VAVIPDLSEPGGSEILEELMSLGDEFRVGSCVVVEADMDVLALLDKAREHGAERIVLFGPRHVEGRRRGVYERTVEPRENPEKMDPMRLVRELWGNLTGSLRLCDYEAAMRILYDKPFTVAECEPGGEGCRGLVREWIGRLCKA
jgi:hypothetical protein